MRRRALLCALLFLAACTRATTPPVHVRAAPPLADKPIRRLAINRAATAPEVKQGAAAAVTEMLIQAASREPRWTVVSEAEPADATVTARIAAFREREGSDYGARRGAAVSLQIFLIPRGAKEPTWTAEYTAEQEPLTYNLFNLWEFLRGGPRWLTANELARIGVDEAVKRLAATAP